jgi:phosphoserine phosphatase
LAQQYLTIVSHFGELALVDAMGYINALDENAIAKQMDSKILRLEHSIDASFLPALFEKFDAAKLDYSTVTAKPKKLLIADMDSTIISCECLDELADFAGKKEEVSAITERAMAGELNFESALTERVRMLKGLGTDALQDCFDQRVKLNPGASQMVGRLKLAGTYCALVSGGFKFFTSRVKDWAGFDEDNSNEFIYENNTLTGEVRVPILGKEAKLARLLALCEEKEINIKDTIAIGDGANDLMMIEAAGLGIAYMAKPIVAARAPARINSGNLESVLAFCGFV